MMDFGGDLDQAFNAEAKASPFSEVQLFRALIRAFGRLRSTFLVEEYHGPKHQVYFNGLGPWGRTPARCELCDVIFVAYRTRPTFEARLTFLQAKLSKEKHSSLCAGFPTHVDAVDFKANLEQWDLLSRRPHILPVPPFRAPPLLLQDAVLSSVGSFGVFHRAEHGGIGFFYSCADSLSVAGVSSTKNGRLVTNAALPPMRMVNGLDETTFTCCMPLFGNALYSLSIGTPVTLSLSTGGPSPLAQWLVGVLRTYARVVGDSPLARELLGRLDVPAVEDEIPLPALVLIKADGMTSNGSSDTDVRTAGRR